MSEAKTQLDKTVAMVAKMLKVNVRMEGIKAGIEHREQLELHIDEASLQGETAPEE